MAAFLKTGGAVAKAGGGGIECDRMLMGFLGYRDGPPGKAPPPFEDPPEGPSDGDDPAGRRSKSRFRSVGSRGGRYAWLISLLIHGGVIVGGLIALKLYFREPTVHPQPANSGAVTPTSIVAGADSTDAIHYFVPAAQASPVLGLRMSRENDDQQAFPSVTSNFRQTLLSLQQNAPPLGPAHSDVQESTALSRPPLHPSHLRGLSNAFEQPAGTQAAPDSALPR